ncbi:hypothetical protein [Streptomyces sp. NBC_01451]|uniref:hypothetical protein n=1 Tax=Streptomyces sp. NBC_01451 TaxID=2903872 RepID=UPI002E30EAB2|nr:hypothetical protein [Streptomyces sp. NBC_01451]
MVFDVVKDRLAVWRDRREVARQRLEAADEFTWVWSDTVNPCSHEFGADLTCRETNTLATLFRLFHHWNTANQLQKEHERGPNCNNAEPHPEIVEEDQ